MTTYEYQVTGMHCGHCEASVRGEVAKLPGVEGVDVSVATGRLTIRSASPLSEADVVAAVDEAGYVAAPI
jgi:copper chaperone CopZ